MWVMPTDPTTHVIQPQPANRAGLSASAGWNNLDRYRHGKYPRLSGTNYDDKDPKGQVKINVLYADGHVNLETSIKDVYRSFQMRDP
jgi:prepilin-type processing-associated H-X9-DG protein